MRRIAFVAIIAGFLFPLMASAPANAQATRTWVSGVGDDANPCSRTAPCKTFPGAISKTAAGGEINCIDPGGFGAVTITKAITIACTNVEAGVLVSGTNGIVVAAGVNDVVVLKGIDLVGVGTGLAGIKFQSGAALHVEDCSISGFTGFGIAVVPTNAATFSITNTRIYNNTAGGIQIRSAAGATTGVISKSTMYKNATGIDLDGFGGATSLNVAIRDTTVNGSSGDGILVTSTVTAVAQVQFSTIEGNATGLHTANGGAVIQIGSSTITGNTTAVNGAAVQSYGNNQMNSNAGGETIAAVSPGLR